MLTVYVRDVVSQHARPHETGARIKRLHQFWRGRMLSEVTGATCRDYASRLTNAAARRDLEDLRSAINHHQREGLHDRVVRVVLPQRAQPRERWLTRDEAARLIWSAWRYRERQKGRPTDKRPRRHVARFMVVARYMGARAGAICEASIEDKRPGDRAWIDLRTGMFYGQADDRRETKKRRQRVQVPPPLLSHMRRWRAAGQRYVVEWRGEPVQRVTKAHRAVVRDAGLGQDVTPHIWRHTVATWLMQAGAPEWEAADYLAITTETLNRVYGHHHPDRAAGIHAALRSHRG